MIAAPYFGAARDASATSRLRLLGLTRHSTMDRHLLPAAMEHFTCLR